MNPLAGRIIGHYQRHARAWDADRNGDPAGWAERPWHDRFIAALPGAGAAVLDLGCGSGAQVATYLAAHGVRVTGIDACPTMISMCRARLRDHAWVLGDMREVALHRPFDGVLAWDSFFHLTPDDQRAMLDVFARHAGPATVLMFNSGISHGEAIGSYRGDALYHASLGPDEYRALLKNIGFEVMAHAVADGREGGGRTVWLARARAAA